MGVDIISKSGEYLYHIVKCGKKYTKIKALTGISIIPSKIGYSKAELDSLYELGLLIIERRRDEI